MADFDDLKNRLRRAALAARKQASEPQLDEAARELVKRARVQKSDLEKLGESVANDREIFATTDIDDINNILDSLRKK